MDKAYLKQLHQQFRPANLRPRAASWYEIKNLSGDAAEISLYDEVGIWGVTASSFADDLRDVTAKSITLRISSPGGDVFDGLAILNSLRQHPATVNVVIEGLAASAASFIAMAGDSIQVAPQAMLMIHDASAMCWGNAADMAETAALLDKASDNIAAVYAQRAGGTPEDWRAAMKAETWYTDQEAVDAGLADSILGKAATHDPSEGDPEESAGSEDGAATPPRMPGASLEPAVIHSSKDSGASPSEVDMRTTEKPAAWDLSAIRAAITAAKEATTHG
ncbi:head maturation protease, ClpP-related [Streptomyces sp. NPDC060011]|uniref:head maturation protease, ClpP-related n=1 Tax=Streptomyces sp. NPDC060011 TaxID=3347037 RepID=UPI0036CD9BF4